MKRAIIIVGLLITLLAIPPAHVLAIETAPRITDREIVERLTRLEEGQNTLRAEIRANANAIRQLREDMNTQVRQLREDMNTQIKQLREDMNAQFDRIDSQFNRLAAIFTTLVVAIIGFAIWDRRTMIRPFETKVKEIEDQIAENRTRLHSLIEALRTLSKIDDRVAEVLKRFNLL